MRLKIHSSQTPHAIDPVKLIKGSKHYKVMVVHAASTMPAGHERNMFFCLYSFSLRWIFVLCTSQAQWVMGQAILQGSLQEIA